MMLTYTIQPFIHNGFKISSRNCLKSVLVTFALSWIHSDSLAGAHHGPSVRTLLHRPHTDHGSTETQTTKQTHLPRLEKRACCHPQGMALVITLQPTHMSALFHHRLEITGGGPRVNKPTENLKSSTEQPGHPSFSPEAKACAKPSLNSPSTAQIVARGCQISVKLIF